MKYINSILLLVTGCSILAMDTGVQQAELQLIQRVKVRELAYPLFYDLVRNNVVVPSSIQNQNKIGVFDVQGPEVAQLVGNSSLVWDVQGVQGNPYLLISCSCDLEGKHGKVISWNLATQRLIAEHKTERKDFFMSLLGYKNDRDVYVIAAAGGVDTPEICLLNALTGELIKKCSSNHTKPVFSIYKLLAHDWFATVQLGGQSICIWDLEGNNWATIAASSDFIHKLSPVMAVFNKDTVGSFVVSHDAQKALSFWRKEDKFALYAHCSWDDLVTAMRVSDDSNYLATGGSKGTLTLWKLNKITDCTRVAECIGHTLKINDIQFLKTSKLFATVSGNDEEQSKDDISVRIWDFCGHQLACFKPSNLLNELEYIQKTEQDNFVIGSSGGDLLFFKVLVQSGKEPDNQKE